MSIIIGIWFVWFPIVVICIFLLSRLLNNSSKKDPYEKESPLDILKKRHANGEISTEEYEERKKRLESN